MGTHYELNSMVAVGLQGINYNLVAEHVPDALLKIGHRAYVPDALLKGDSSNNFLFFCDRIGHHCQGGVLKLVTVNLLDIVFSGFKFSLKSAPSMDPQKNMNRFNLMNHSICHQ